MEATVTFGQPDWLDDPCYYVATFDGNKPMTLVAGPYQSEALAEGVSKKARTLVFAEGGKSKNASLRLGVIKHRHGHDHSYFGMIEP
jgi:hypothetical protein